MSTALLVEFYQQLPQRQADEEPESWLVRLQTATKSFKRKVGRRYNEGTLQRLLTNCENTTRQAAVLALGLLGTMASNAGLASRLHDEDDLVQHLAGNALWAVWFRGDSEDNNKELQRLLRLTDREKALVGLNALIEHAPGFAEAYNQRAILYFQARQFEKAIADCEKVLALNPHHFGAQAGIGQCYLHLNKFRAALKAFRNALRINPTLEGVEAAIRDLETALGEEGKL